MCSPHYVVISPVTFTPHSDLSYDFQFSPVHELATLGMKVLERCEDAMLHSELYLELPPVHLKLNTPQDPQWANEACS